MGHLRLVVALGRFLWEQLLAEAGICHGRDGGLSTGGRESSKGGEEMPEKGEERKIIKIRSN